MKIFITTVFALFFLQCAKAQMGYYRLVIERFECIKPTIDDVLERDGKGDEIQVGAIAISHYKMRNGLKNNRSETFYAETPVMGDINGNNWRRPFNEHRIMAGDRSPLGGVQGNNMFPFGSRFQRLNAPVSYGLPLIAWEGFLSKTPSAYPNEMVVCPLILEVDEAKEFLSTLLSTIRAVIEGPLAAIPDPLRIVGAMHPGITIKPEMNKDTLLGMYMLPPNYNDQRLFNNSDPLGDPHTRYVGMQAVPGKGYQYMPRAVFLTYDKAERLVNTDIYGLGKGHFLINYKDAEGTLGGGEYNLYFTLEKVGGNMLFATDNDMFKAEAYVMTAGGDHSRFREVLGIYKLTNQNSGKVLEVMDNNTIAGGTLVQNDFHNGNNQKFKIEVNDFGEYRIKNVNSNLYLDVSEGSQNNGAAIIQWDWRSFSATSNNNNQRWIIQPQGDGTFIIFNINSGKPIEVQGESRNNNATIDQWDNSSRRHQRWMIQQVK